MSRLCSSYYLLSVVSQVSLLLCNGLCALDELVCLCKRLYLPLSSLRIATRHCFIASRFVIADYIYVYRCIAHAYYSYRYTQYSRRSFGRQQLERTRHFLLARVLGRTYKTLSTFAFYGHMDNNSSAVVARF